MLIIENVSTAGWEPAIRGMRNPKDSWNKSDSEFYRNIFQHEEPSLGFNDITLANTLAKGGPVHAKYRRMIVVYLDIVAPLYWWKEFDTYKVGTVANSCSTMHRIHAKELTLDDFSHDKLTSYNMELLKKIIENLNYYRALFIKSDKTDLEAWNQMIQMLPSSYMQRRTIMLNYEVLAHIYHSPRYNHKLEEWRVFCNWIKTLPYAEELIINPNQFDHKSFK